MARVTKKKENTNETAKETVQETTKKIAKGKAAQKLQDKAQDKMQDKAQDKMLTRAEKKAATLTLIKEVLRQDSRKHNDLIDEVSKVYAEKFGGENTENINDVKGRVGSVLDIMKKDGEVLYEGGRYALNAEKTPKTAIDNAVKEKETMKKPARVKGQKTVKTTVEEPAETVAEEKAVENEKAVKKTAKKQTKKAEKVLKTKEKPTEEPSKEEKPTEELPLPPAPLQPIAPVAPITPDVAPEPIPEVVPEKKQEEKGKKKTARAKGKKEENIKNEAPVFAMTEEKSIAATAEETPKAEELPTVNKTPMGTPLEMILDVPSEKIIEEKPAQEAQEIQNPPAVKEKAEIAPKNVVDMSFLFGNVKPKAISSAEKKREKTVEEKAAEKPAAEQFVLPKKEEKGTEKNAEKTLRNALEKKEEKTEDKKEKLTVKKPVTRGSVKNVRKVPQRPLTSDERLREAFLKRMRALGGDYFEYYSVYLLERYSMKNGRRLESMRISGGINDGGIDGEIELTDKLGFKETIYIQAKNWDPEKGKEEYWVVGETLLQQFIGACAYRQVKDGKQHCRGIFITTSRFTPEAKHLLDAMSDKIVGYDGADLYEAAKECEFGLIYENGNWKLDEKLLSGTKAFFNMI